MSPKQPAEKPQPTRARTAFPNQRYFTAEQAAEHRAKATVWSFKGQDGTNAELARQYGGNGYTGD